MTDSTPLNADDELKLINGVLNQSNLSDFSKEGIMKLILADRKRVALGARMDEVGKLKLPKMRFDEYGYSPDENAVGFNSAVQLAHNNKLYRIAELKQELEKYE